jgi:hypothetical protein
MYQWNEIQIETRTEQMELFQFVTIVHQNWSKNLQI